MTDREQIVAEARSLIGTPFQHQARLPGIGIDCAGVVIVVARRLGMVPDDFDVGNYPREADGVSMLGWCRQHMIQVKQAEMQVGDVVAVIVDKLPQHLGVVGDYRHGGFSIIHAAAFAKPKPRVIETRLMFSQGMRFAAAFRMPGVV